ncbi:DNA primase [Kocuria sp. NBRC 114282]|uniref:DNA primase n=1 Tax=Kocuria sp. NBRC 114282 TaxID=2994520 RepID=UPI0024A1D72B|nr:DNA primase [Kocuria sp. NBRC 114282]GLU85977.1 DNA primase [Kocuria sp. NBRC 114282]
MAGLIKREDIDEVRSRTDIREIVEGYVTLKSAGIGSYKGLCPFHDERTPSFHVRPQYGTYHCFGCDESGDVIAFVQAMEHTTFAETVERLAARIGYELHYEQGSGPDKAMVGRRQRLLDAHKVAAEYFQAQLRTAGARAAHTYLGDRGFSPQDAADYGVGYAPQGWSRLLDHLRKRGYTDDELEGTGMFSSGRSGLIDRFRGRLIFPIRGIGGEIIGFGARKLYDDDQGPKYLNTPETQLYKKSTVLYGIDKAKRQIAKQRQVVVVEGYTDVMAMHLAGVPTAVATCGTAFGAEHIKVVRRFLSDDGSGGEVVFTFDGDKAGQKAALRAFQEDQRFMAQTFVAVEPNGMDPCELRLARGDAAVRSLLSAKRPLFEFAIRAAMKRYDLESLEGRVQAMRATAPIVARIRDTTLRPAYARQLAGWLGLEVPDVVQAVEASARADARGESGGQGRGAGLQRTFDRPVDGSDQRPRGPQDSDGPPDDGAAHPPRIEWPDPRDPLLRTEKEALEVVVQVPHLLGPAEWQQFTEAECAHPVHTAVHRGVVQVLAGIGADQQITPGRGWIEALRAALPQELHGYLAGLSMRALPASSAQQLERYASGVINHLFDRQIHRRQADLRAELQRTSSVEQPERFREISRQLLDLEARRRELRPA